MINNENIEINKETGELLINGRTKWPGPYEYFFENGKVTRKLIKYN